MFVYVGLDPNTGLAADGLERDPGGLLVTDPELHTTLPGIFAAGSAGTAPPDGRPPPPVTAPRPPPASIATSEDPMAELVTVHDPRGFPPTVAAKPLAPRLEGLDGKRVYLVDCLFDNSDVFMGELQHWFGEQLPAVRRPSPGRARAGSTTRAPGGDRRRWRRRHSRRRCLKHL